MEEKGPPRSFPIKSLENLRSRSYFDSAFFSYNKCSVPLRKGAATSRLERPRLLACHDLGGNYSDDQWIQGSQNSNAYTLTHWRLLDSFVYFSHDLVTLPPPCWTNAAHLHGVQVLGTLITEWSEGAEICKELFASEESARMYADRLAELAEALGFDGWLINIENAIAREQIVNLQAFVAQLSASTHARVPDSLIIWYDAVTTEGKLTWQDRLNEKNKPFFDVCDGIFINYTWKKDYPKQCALTAGDRAYDVYMGVDVFGRNTYGGGQYQCDVALKAAQDAGVSAALFAPGWAYETHQDEVRWWNMIENCWPAARVDPVQTPFFTDFDIGLGKAKYLDGKQVSELPWNNTSSQNLQPRLHAPEPTQFQLATSASKESAAYSGGVCIKVLGDVAHDEVGILQLYHTDAVVEDARLGVSYSVCAESDANFCLALSVQDNKGAKAIFFLLDSTAADAREYPRNHHFTHISAVFVYSEQSDSPASGVGNEQSSEMEVSTQQSAVDHVTSWKVRKFLVEWGDYSLVDVFGVFSRAMDLQPILIKLLYENETLFDGDRFVNLTQKHANSQISGKSESSSTPGLESSPPYMVKLGHISISGSSHEHSTSTDSVLVGYNPSWEARDDGSKFLDVTLTWRHPDADSKNPAAGLPLRYHVYVMFGRSEEDPSNSALTYLGMTMLGSFYVYMLPVSRQARRVTFKLHVQCDCGEVPTNGNDIAYTLEIPHDSGRYVRKQPSLSDWLFRELQ